LLATASAIGVVAGALGLLYRRRQPPIRRSRSEPERWQDATNLTCGQSVHDPAGGRAPVSGDADAAEITRRFLLYFVVPLWTAAGVADWLCHRTSHIESTSGLKETLIHILMLIEVGVPIMAGLFLEITSPVLALMIASFLVHDVTALWDVSYAVTRRDVTPIEQHVHSFLEMIPLMAVSFIAVLHWSQFKALFGFGDEKADWSIRMKRDPLPTSYLAGALTSFALLEWVPYLEEAWRDLKVSRGRMTPPREAG